jgi:ribosomal protein S12 methylthiotransferase
MTRSALRRVFCASLGCSKNTADSEKIAGALSSHGFEIVGDARSADIAIVNTCGFIRSATEENIAVILDLAELKKEGALKLVGVVGCLVARYGDELKRGMPEVDFWAGCGDVVSILEAAGARGASVSASPPRKRLPGDVSHVRYLKISDGCDNACSYCAIPSIKGPMRSRPAGDIVREAAALAEDGAAEICLVAQDLTAYGRDLGVRGGLVSLLDALEASLPEDMWLRLLYLQPSGVNRALLERVAGGRQVLPYLDIPIQHSVPEVLKRMNRGCDPGNLAGIFRTARSIRPDFALRTTCMVGFPGETGSDFITLMRFLEDICFDRVGAFAFSPEEGAPASGMPRQISERTKESRLRRLMSLQEDMSLARQALFVGREFDVMIDSDGHGGNAAGRSFREAYDVDGIVAVSGIPDGVSPGRKVRVLMTGASEHDMEARFLSFPRAGVRL